MALSRAAEIQRLCSRTWCKLATFETACHVKIGCSPQHSKTLALLHVSTFRLVPCCWLRHSSRHLATTDLADKPWYTRWAIKSNDRFAASLGRISPKAQKQYLQLVEGTKLFYYDAKHAYQLNRRMKKDKLHLSDLDWRDIYIKKQISKDLAKVLPTLMLMCLPFVFYVMLPILFFFPRPFLSDQFFTREQLLEYNARFHRIRLSLHPSIIGQLVRKVKKIPDSAESQAFLEAIERLDSGLPLDSSHLLDHRDLFDVVLALNGLPRIHLVTLCRLYSLKSFLLPSFLLRSRLNRALTFLHAMDKALLRENLQGLSQRDLEKLCFERGLNSDNVDRAVLANWLGDWVQLSTNLTEKEQSLLAHAAVLLVKSQSLRVP